MKTATIARTATGKWFTAIVCEVADPATLPKTDAPVGIVVELTTFATLGTGEQIANPRFFRHDEAALAKAQRRFSKKEKAHRSGPHAVVQWRTCTNVSRGDAATLPTSTVTTLSPASISSVWKTCR